jgi:hypothetical protein
MVCIDKPEWHATVSGGGGFEAVEERFPKRYWKMLENV